VTAVDATTDRVAWSHDPAYFNGKYPISISLTNTPAGKRLVVVYALQYDDPVMRSVELLDPATGELLHLFKVYEDDDLMSLGTSAEVGVAHPVKDAHLLYVRGTTWAMAERALPLDGNEAPRAAAYVTSLPESGTPQRFGTARGPGNLGRVATTQNRYSGGDRVWLTNDGGSPNTRGPFTCVGTNPCGSTLEVNHAVPDPTDADRLFLACMTGSHQGNVVRVHYNGTCDAVLDGMVLPELSYPYRLAVVQD
jgi:hypothetical protein